MNDSVVMDLDAGKSALMIIGIIVTMLFVIFIMCVFNYLYVILKIIVMPLYILVKGCKRCFCNDKSGHQILPT